MNDESVAVVLSGMEVFHLVHLLGGDALLEIDPAASPAVQIAENGSSVRPVVEQSLRDKECLATTQDGRDAVNVVVAALISVVAFPDMTFGVVTVRQDGGGDRTAYYLQDLLAVEVQQTTSESYRLAALGKGDIAQHIRERWLRDVVGPPPGEERHLPEHVLARVRWLTEQRLGGAYTRTVLENANIPAAMATSITRTIEAPWQRGGLIVVRPNADGGVQIAEVSLFLGDDGVWLFTSHRDNEAPQVDVIPCAATELPAVLGQFIDQCLSAEGHLPPRR